jgi:hypothetical protein
MSSKSAPRFFTEDDVRAHLHMADLIDAMERALVEFSAVRNGRSSG